MIQMPEGQLRNNVVFFVHCPFQCLKLASLFSQLVPLTMDKAHSFYEIEGSDLLPLDSTPLWCSRQY